MNDYNIPFHDYVSIDADRLASSGYYIQDIELGDGTYQFTFKWNSIDMSLTVDIADADGMIYSGEVMRLNVPLWRGISDPRLPEETLVPLSNNFDRTINLKNLNRSVFLCIDDLAPGDDNDATA